MRGCGWCAAAPSRRAGGRHSIPEQGRPRSEASIGRYHGDQSAEGNGAALDPVAADWSIAVAARTLLTLPRPIPHHRGMPPTPYALSMKQPWAALLVHGRKSIELRFWPTARRGRILIHAARVPDPRPEAWAWVPPELAGTRPGWRGIVGAAESTGCAAFGSGRAFVADSGRHLNDPAWFCCWCCTALVGAGGAAAVRGVPGMDALLSGAGRVMRTAEAVNYQSKGAAPKRRGGGDGQIKRVEGEMRDAARAVLSRITVAGFKSIGPERSIDIRPLTLLAGANSPGKSSIMQPLLLLKQTLEAGYDPGPLLLNGLKRGFTLADQLLAGREGTRRRHLRSRTTPDIGTILPGHLW